MLTVKRGWTVTINPGRVRRNTLSLAGAPVMHAGNTHISAGLPLKDVTTTQKHADLTSSAPSLTSPVQSCSVLQPLRMIDPASLHVHHSKTARITAKTRPLCAFSPPQTAKMTAGHGSATRPQLLRRLTAKRAEEGATTARRQTQAKRLKGRRLGPSGISSSSLLQPVSRSLIDISAHRAGCSRRRVLFQEHNNCTGGNK